MDANDLAWALSQTLPALSQTLPDMRERIATAALQGMLSNSNDGGGQCTPWFQQKNSLVAREAVAYADALIAELARGPRSTVEADEKAIRGALRAEFVRGLTHAAAIVRSDKANSKAEVLLGKLSDRAEEMSPEIAGLFADFTVAWADDAAETAAAIDAVKHPALSGESEDE